MDSWTQLQQLLVEWYNINFANDYIPFKDLQYEMKHTSTICCSTMPLSIKLVWLGNLVVEFVQFAQSCCCWPKLLLELHHFRLLDTSRWLAISHHSHFHSLFVSFWLLTTIVIRDRVAPWRRSITKIECGFALIICRLQTPPDRFSSMFLLQSESETQWQLSWILHRVHGADDCGNNYECNENQSKGHHLQCRCS